MLQISTSWQNSKVINKYLFDSRHPPSKQGRLYFYSNHSHLQIQNMNNTQQQSQVYAIQVAGISCINCANNIKIILTQNINDSTLKVNVNVMQEKVYITTKHPKTADQSIAVLKTTKYFPVSEPVLLSNSKENHRNIAFLVKRQIENDIKEKLEQAVGITTIKLTENQERAKISIEYNCEMIKGRQIADIIQQFDKGYLVVNDKIQGFKSCQKVAKQDHSLRKTIAIWLYFLVVHMLFPVLPMTQKIYEECSTFPKSFGIYSLSVMVNIGLTLYILNSYAKGYIFRAYDNYKTLHTANMETLIALGSLSASSLALFFILRYSIVGYDHLHMAIMDINDALTSASVIVLTVTIGKNFESRAKLQIEKITDEIFPESVLFQDMQVEYIEMRNRQLKAIDSKQYDASLIQKGDILRPIIGRVLIDSIIIQGSAKVVQSARTGNDNVVQLKKGDRLESGAVVYNVDDCLVEVESVLQNSLLLKIAGHIKFSQNSEENNESGIQAICQKVSNIFVKTVIILSLITVFVWTILLQFEIVHVHGCKICWIFQRGISVLVASCPCALGLAVPSVIAITLKLAIKSGILIRSSRLFESMKWVKKIAFDKTGTLFTRLERIQRYKILSNHYQEEHLWELVALIQKQLRHPLAEILYKQALNRSKINGTNFNFILISQPLQQSLGVSAKISQKKSLKQFQVFVGNRKMLKNRKIYLANPESQDESLTAIYLAINNIACMEIKINTHSDLRPQALHVMDTIKQQNIDIHILSGDSQQSVSQLGSKLKLKRENLHAEFTAIDKLNWINQEQRDHQSVIMVGDGLNDIPCLQEADIGISINAKSELNINAADIIILSENLHKITAVIRFLRRGNLFIRMNLFWAFAYNIVTMPVVAGVFYHWNIVISPIWSCVAMSCSSLIVVGFSHLLACFHYDDSLKPQLKQRHDNSTMVDSTRQLGHLTMLDEIN